MNQSSVASKRLAKNTILLYLRTFITMCVNLFISREILDILGFEDYGIYNVVGGMVAMFSLVSSSLTLSITRYLTYELGHGDREKLRRIFSTSLNIQLILSAIIIVSVEIIGLWFLNVYANIPTNRLFAANWVLQCSLVTFVLNLVSLPYNSSIISHEKMNIYAYVSIFEVLLKLLTVYVLYLLCTDKLIMYAVFLMIVAFIIRFIYQIYCVRNFEECRYIPIIDKSLMKEMFGFAGWSFLGTSVNLFNTHGVNVLSNLFFGVTINTARAIASQAGSALWTFVDNFTMAINPQIIKNYAAGDMKSCFLRVFQATKYSSFLVLLVFIPLLLETDFILSLWLKDVPDDAVLFFQLTMLCIIVDLPGRSIEVLAKATGNIRNYYIKTGLVAGLVFPITYVLFELRFPSYTAYLVYAVVYVFLFAVRVLVMHIQVVFPVRVFIIQVIVRVLLVAFLSFIPSLVVRLIVQDGFIRLLLIIIVNILSLLLCTLYIGMTKYERLKIISFIGSKMRRLLRL